MRPILAIVTLIGAASAFAPASLTKASLVLNVNLADLPGSTKPVGPFDPFNLATAGSDETLAWFQAAELKHSRVAMLAVTGYLVQGAGIHFPGMLSSSISFESLSTMKPFESWALVPDEGKAQILAICFLTELVTESNGPHYTRGGDTPMIVFPAIDFSNVEAAKLKRRKDSELNNGRLAMISIMSFIAAANIPGSVPALINNPAF